MKAYTDLFKAFESHSIPWCSWKSNEHLQAGLDGLTDLDLLFYEHDRQRAEEIFKDNGFIIFNTPEYRGYPGVIDAISLDPKTGRLLHAHAHFLLASGEKYLKGVILPWNKDILENRISSEIAPDIYTSTPAHEAVLLTAREALKIRWRDQLGAQDMWGGTGFTTELAWLKDRTKDEDIEKTARTLLNEQAASIIPGLMFRGAKTDKLLRLRACVKTIAADNGWRRMGPILALYTAWLHEALYLLTRLTEKTGLFQDILVRRRTLPDEGLIVAFVGADGSGKSTITKTITSQWQHKIDVTRIYFGSGDGANSALQMLLKTVLAAGVKIKGAIKSERKPDESAKTVSTPAANRDVSFSTVLCAIIGVLSKKQHMRRAQKLRKKGHIVICDRWPQTQNPGINDGPLLSGSKDHKNGLYRRVALWEEQQFTALCTDNQPDIAIKLIPSLDMALSRKPDDPQKAETIAEKIASIQKLKFDGAVESHKIDADKPLETVLEKARDIVFSHAQKRPAPPIKFYECFGLPGAGKTTISKALPKDSGFKSVDDIFASHNMSAMDKIALTLRSFICSPITYLLILKLAFETNAWHSKIAMDCLFKMPVQRLRLQAAIKDNRYFIEQLLLQNIWTIFVSTETYSAKPEKLSPLIQRLYQGMNNIILYFEIDVKEAAARVAARDDGKSRFDGLDKDEIAQRLEKTAALTDDIIKAAQFAGLKIVRVDGSQPSEKMIETLKL